jgi:hypothetical protein
VDTQLYETVAMQVHDKLAHLATNLDIDLNINLRSVMLQLTDRFRCEQELQLVDIKVQISKLIIELEHSIQQGAAISSSYIDLAENRIFYCSASSLPSGFHSFSPSLQYYETEALSFRDCHFMVCNDIDKEAMFNKFINPSYQGLFRTCLVSPTRINEQYISLLGLYFKDPYIPDDQEVTTIQEQGKRMIPLFKEWIRLNKMISV